MSVSPRTSTTLRAMPILPSIQHSTLETIERAEDVTDRLQTRKQVDQRSDAELLEAYHIVAQIQRQPEDAQALARLALIRLARGISLDDIEDDHCSAASRSAADIQTLGRATVARIQEHYRPGGPEGAA